MLDLEIEEIKLLLLNLSKKKEGTTNEIELEKINKRVEELSSTLKNKNQITINNTYNDIVESVDKLLIEFDELKKSILDTDDFSEEKIELDEDIENITPDSEEIFKMTMLDLDSLDMYIDKIKSIKQGLQSIYDYQVEIQNVKNPINFYFDFLLFPINKPIETRTPNQLITNPTNNFIGVIEQQSNIIPDNLINTVNKSSGINVNAPEFINKRHKVSYFARVGNYEKIYELLKDNNMKLVTSGMEDILNQPASDGSNGSVYDQVLLVCPVTDDFEFVGEDELSKQPTEIHMSSKAQDIFGGSSNLLDSSQTNNHSFIVSEEDINYDVDLPSLQKIPKANSILNNIKKFTKF